jgi:hypothetical protein
MKIAANIGEYVTKAASVEGGSPDGIIRKQAKIFFCFLSTQTRIPCAQTYFYRSQHAGVFCGNDDR